MKVCFLSSLHPPMDKRVFDKEARTLAAAGHQVTHLAPGDGILHEVDGVQIVTYQGRKGIFGRLAQLTKLYRLACDIDADVYHCNEVDSWMVGAALRILERKVCVFDVHEHYPEEFAENYYPKWAQPVARVMIAILINGLSRMASGIVLAKSSLEKDFSHLPKDRVHLVENFVSLAALESASREDVREPPLKLIHLGLIGRLRGWPQLLQALTMARCHSVQLLILGATNDGSEQALRTEIERLGLANRVRYEAWLPYEEAMAQVRLSDAGLIMFQPGLYNHVHALPHKMFDYMAGELVVIAPGFAVEVAAIVRDAQCGLLIDPSNPGSIAEAIDHLCDNPDQLQMLGRSGRTAVLNRYNWEAESERLLAMYKNFEQHLLTA
jgi:glycosyltransferase involved in cell wall biosynthesis